MSNTQTTHKLRRQMPADSPSTCLHAETPNRRQADCDVIECSTSQDRSAPHSGAVIASSLADRTVSADGDAIALNESTTEEALLRGALDRDPAAWRVLRERHEAYLFGVARSFRGIDADDVVQTAWLRLLESGSAIRDPQCLRAWLACVVRRESIAQLSRRRREQVTGYPDRLNDVPCSEASPEQTVIRHETEHLVRDAMTELSDRHAILLRLLAASGLDYKSIGRELALPVGSIGPTRARALRHLERALAGRGVDADLAFAV